MNVLEGLGNAGEKRLRAQEIVGQAVDRIGVRRHRPLGVQIDVKDAAGRDVAHELEGADLDEAMTVVGLEAGGLGVKDDLAHQLRCRIVACFLAQSRHDPPHLVKCIVEAAAGIHNEIGVGPLVGIGGLAGQQPVELLLGHAGSGEGAPTLDLGGGAHHHEAIHGAVAADLEQQRNIEDDERLLRRRGGRDEAGFGLAHQRMDDGLERRQGGRVGEQQGGEPVAIDGAIDQRFGEKRCNRGDGAAARGIEPVHLEVGVEHRAAELGEHPGGLRLAHGERAGEADQHHASGSMRSRTSSARSSGVTAGRRPNQRSKPGTA